MTTFSFGQVVKRLFNESAEQFATRVKPDSSILTHKVIETKWNSTSVIIAFYQQTYKLPKQNDPNQQDYLHIIATIFIQADSNHYTKFLIDTIGTEGGDPNIENVSFANADKDTRKELIIIVSWEQRHYDVYGILYGTFVYDDVLTNPKMKLNFIKEISEKLNGGCDCSRSDGTNDKAKFKTSDDIKKELKRLRYN